MTCAEPSCTRRNLEGFWFCRHHKCKSTRCDLRCAGTLSYCDSHRCYYPSCKKQHRAGIWACSSHKCKLSTCNSIRELRREHCAAHKCGKNTCHRARGSNTEGCETHTCRLRDVNNNNSACDKLVQQTPGSTSCADHACGRCPKAFISIDIPFCSRHRCQWTLTSCNQSSEYPSRFCEQHKCPIPGCRQSCRAAGMYCDHHRCYFGECPLPSTVWRDSSYCEDHTCPVDDCIQAILPDGLQCDHHTCVWGLEHGVRCYEAKYGGDFCSQHRCIEAHCSNRRDGDGEGTFCAEHVCAAEDCYNRRGSSGEYCEHHRAETTIATMPAGPPPLGPVARSKRPAAQDQDIQNYGMAYLDGYRRGVNVQPGHREYAQRWMDQNWPPPAAIDSTGRGGDQRAQMRQGMDDVTELLTQRQMELEGNNGVSSSSSRPRQPPFAIEAGEQQTLEDLIPSMNNLDLGLDGNHTDDLYVHAR